MRTKRVYFIKPIGMDGPVKIGNSHSPTGRRNTLECWSPFPLEIVAEIDGDITLERRFHARFVASHRGHEWFDWSAELQSVINEIRAGTFDIRTLPEPKHLPRNVKVGNGWGPRQKLLMSYCTRIRHAERKSGMRLPHHLDGWRCWLDTPAKMSAIDAFLADPQTHGETALQRLMHHKERALASNSPWARSLLAQIAELEAA